MSLYDKASIALIPSGTKASKLYSVLPANGNGDFTHTRGSTATRINKDGFIEEGIATNVPRLDYPITSGVVGDCPHLLLEPSRTNILVRSNEFNTTWGLGSTMTLTSGQASTLTGSNDAWLLTSDGTSGFGQVNQSVSHSGSHTFSVFAKEGTNQTISLRSISGTDVRAEFNLNTGAVVGSSNTTSTEIQNYGNGWYRVCMTFNATNSQVFIYPNPIGTADGGNILIQNAQLEAGDFKTSYIPTTSASVTRSADECNSSGTTADFNDSEGVLFVEFAALSNDLTHRRIAISDGTTSNLVYISFDTTSNRILASANGKILVYTTTDITEFQKAAVYYNATAPKLFVNGVLRETESAMSAITGLNELAFDNGAGGNDFYGKVKQAIVFNEALSDSELVTLTTQ
jgi:hypothetical protein